MEEIGNILPKVLRPQLSRLEPPVVEVLAPFWTRVAGKALAKACRPVAFSAGTLTLAMEDPAWAEPLQQLADEIRAHVNSFLGRPVVKHLRILGAGNVERWHGAQGRPENPPASNPNWGNWPRKASGPDPELHKRYDGLPPGTSDASMER